MRAALIAALALVSASGAAAAQTATTTATETPAAESDSAPASTAPVTATAPVAAASTVRGALFITPMGEPFRSSDPDVPPIRNWFTYADIDKDGKIGQQEYLADALVFFDRVDANHDHNLTSAETTAYWQVRAPELLTGWSANVGFEGVRRGSAGPGNDAQEAARRRERERQRNERGPRGAARYGLLNNAEPIMTCDTNFDRRIMQDEYMACAAQRFTEIDTNHDGFFTLDEGERR
ncbi:MAG TPA: hypothetical protein VG841_02110 [Caulobacterales bacterium]|nr:hypothetical protein [Caulobacterales bacterium]